MNAYEYHSFTASFQVGENTCKYHVSSQPDPPSHKNRNDHWEDESSKETMTKSSLKQNDPGTYTNQLPPRSLT